MWAYLRDNWSYHIRQIKTLIMEKIIKWHKEAIYGEPQHIASNLEMAKELSKLDTVTFQEYTKMCKRLSIHPMRDETFFHKMSNS